jgi:CO/xanthine dehydrogenase Mo-binding subunit
LFGAAVKSFLKFAPETVEEVTRMKASPYGGGTWASRGAGVRGEANPQTAKVLRNQILDAAAVIPQSSPAELDIADNKLAMRHFVTCRYPYPFAGRD